MKFNETNEFPNKRDLFYWLLIIIILLIVVSVWRTNEPGVLADQIALGGTFLSILLAVIAIIFSFVQSSESTRSSHHIFERIGEVTQSISTLNQVRTELEQLVNKQKNTAEALASGLETMKENTDDLVLKKKAEDGISAWNNTKKKLDSLDRFVEDGGLINFVNKALKRYSEVIPDILELLDPKIAISLTELRNKLSKERDIDLDLISLHILITDLQKQGLISPMEFKEETKDLYIKKAP